MNAEEHEAKLRESEARLNDRSRWVSREEAKRLRALAEKATPGPWLVHEWGRLKQVVNGMARATVKPGIAMVGRGILAKEVSAANAAYIAAMNPETARRLLDTLEAAEAALRVRDDTAEATIARLERRVAELEGTLLGLARKRQPGHDDPCWCRYRMPPDHAPYCEAARAAILRGKQAPAPQEVPNDA